MNNTITIVGNLVHNPKITKTNFGDVARLRVASNERIQKDGAWKDGPTTFVDVSAWRGLANAVAGLEKGASVIITGKLKGREYETQAGTKGYGYEIEADAVGTNLVRTSASSTGVETIEADVDSPWQ